MARLYPDANELEERMPRWMVEHRLVSDPGEEDFRRGQLSGQVMAWLATSMAAVRYPPPEAAFRVDKQQGDDLVQLGLRPTNPSAADTRTPRPSRATDIARQWSSPPDRKLSDSAAILLQSREHAHRQASTRVYASARAERLVDHQDCVEVDFGEHRQVSRMKLPRMMAAMVSSAW
ncbi:hypothetical protein [Nocardia sp. NBC_00403]|uniref:hypothetical protein n=1 Tax=Nocardia sp. NBC_00403 TaxID=2975990 RepID=UPI002E1D8A67